MFALNKNKRIISVIKNRIIHNKCDKLNSSVEILYNIRIFRKAIKLNAIPRYGNNSAISKYWLPNNNFIISSGKIIKRAIAVVHSMKTYSEAFLMIPLVLAFA